MKNIDYENLYHLNKPYLEQYKQSFSEVLNSGWFILGKKVEAFEKEFAAYLKAPEFIGLASGLDALELPLIAMDFPEPSEVIVPSNTYIATINAIINTGHTPVFVEPDMLTYNIDPKKIEEKITSKTKAIMIVHLYGKPCEIDEIMALCKKHDLKLIEDCAQSHGAMYKEKMTGTFGQVGAFSFYPTKNLGALGDAGAIICKDEHFYQKLKALRNYGSEKKYYNQLVGRNCRLDELQASFLNVKLPFLEKMNLHKIALADRYNQLLNNKIQKPLFFDNGSHVYHIYNILVENRDDFQKYLKEKGVETLIHYPVAPHLQEGYQQFFKHEKYPITEKIHAKTLSLPISFATTFAEVEEICSKINDFQ